MGHVLRKEGNDWVKKSMDMTVEGSKGRGKTKNDMRESCLRET